MPDDIPVTKVSQMKQQNLSPIEIVDSLKNEGYTLSQINEAFVQANVKANVDNYTNKMVDANYQVPNYNLTQRQTNNLQLPPLPPKPNTPGNLVLSPSVMNQLQQISQQKQVPNTSSQMVPQRPSLPTQNQPMQTIQQSDDIKKPDLDNMQLSIMDNSSIKREQMQHQSAQPQQQQQAVRRGVEHPPLHQVEITADIEEIAEAIIDEKWREFMDELNDVATWKEKVDTEISNMKDAINKVHMEVIELQKSFNMKISEYNENIGEIGSSMKAFEGVFKKVIDPLVNNIKELSKITKDLKEQQK